MTLVSHPDGRALVVGGVLGKVGPGGSTLGTRSAGPDGPVWFGEEGVPLFGWVHRPEGRAAGAVVLCPPLFGEQVSTEHTFLVLARALAEAGLVAVRFAYEGTGDSASPTDAAGLVPRWIGDVGRAVAVARSCVDGPVALLGMRMGATLAALAAERGKDVDALVLWDPCPSGRSFLRRLQSLHALRFGARDAGLVEVPGAGMSVETAADLARLRLPVLGPERRALVLVRPGGRLADGHAPGATVGRVEVAVLDPGEQESLLEVEPVVARVPEPRLATVRDWLTGALGEASTTVREGGGPGRHPRPGMPTVPVAQPHRPAGALPHVHRGDQPTTLSVEVDGVQRRVQERSVRLGPLGLFAIEASPAPARDEPVVDGPATGRTGQPASEEGGPVVVFLSSGGASHVGPCRLWVSLARRWAALGLRCVRVDESGIGESPVRPGQAPQVVRPPEAFDDVAEVVAAVAGDPRRVVLVGLCSGAYQALESALELSPLGVLAVNVGLWFTPPEVKAGGRVSDRRRIHLHRPSWVARLRSRLPGTLGLATRVVRRWWQRQRPGGDRRAWQMDLVRRGVRVCCLGRADEDSGVLARDLGRLDVAGAAGSFEVDVVEDLDHSVLSARDRQLVTDWLTDRLFEVLGRADAECAA